MLAADYSKGSYFIKLFSIAFNFQNKCDFPALSAYQKALKIAEDQFWKDSGAYYGLGIVYLHFKAYGRSVLL